MNTFFVKEDVYKITDQQRKSLAVGVVCLLKAPIKIPLYEMNRSKQGEGTMKANVTQPGKIYFKLEMWCNKLHKDIQIPCSDYVTKICLEHQRFSFKKAQ